MADQRERIGGKKCGFYTKPPIFTQQQGRKVGTNGSTRKLPLLLGMSANEDEANRRGRTVENL
jgi:hypothetical protein